MRLYICGFVSNFESSSQLTFIRLSEQEAIILTRDASSQMDLDDISLPLIWNAEATRPLPRQLGTGCTHMELAGCFSLLHHRGMRLSLPKYCTYWGPDGQPSDSKHMQLVLCPSVPPHRLRRANRANISKSDPDKRCIIEELFGDEREPLMGSYSCGKSEDWFGDKLMPRKISLSLGTPKAITLWIKSLGNKGNRQRILSFFNQAIGAFAAYYTLQFMDQLLTVCRSFNSNFQTYISAAFEAFASGTPLGIKLHVELATLLTQVTVLADLSSSLQSHLLITLGQGADSAVFLIVALIGFVFGLQAYLSFASDLSTLCLHLPFALINVISSHICHYHFVALGYSWRIMRRGKKRKNEHPQDQGSVSVEHIVSGVLLFLPLLALFPTTAAFHILAVAASMATYAPGALLLCLANFGSIVHRFFLSRGVIVLPIQTLEMHISVYEVV